MVIFFPRVIPPLQNSIKVWISILVERENWVRYDFVSRGCLVFLSQFTYCCRRQIVQVEASSNLGFMCIKYNTPHKSKLLDVAGITLKGLISNLHVLILIIKNMFDFWIRCLINSPQEKTLSAIDSGFVAAEIFRHEARSQSSNHINESRLTVNLLVQFVLWICIQKW